MMKKSSNIDIEQVFNQLAKIKSVEPNADLYLKILNKRQLQKVIPLFWVRAAACFLLLFFATELYILYKKENIEKKDFSVFISQTNNTLYNE